ncbi:MAG: N-acetyl-gamma-glutamyl-phosphate reductase [Deltaproteobacteria bacterium]|nr:N-acetyl-gamma-glutamyl-phosphate reductase [Deltaproteobacteria bacterium]
MPVRCAIVGASGYTGVELVRLLDAHPNATLTHVSAESAAGKPLSASWSGLLGVDDRLVEPFDVAAIRAAADVVFLGLPHTVSARYAPALLDAGLTVIDLGADFRFRDAATYERAYGIVHPAPELCAQAVYGLVEKNRALLPGARLIAAPGCYPTATALAALPLIEAGLVDWLIADCVSGVSGAGRKPGPRNLYCEVQESVSAYSIAGAHRHRPEIEATLGVPVTFTPHLVPMVRGMVATVHVRPTRPVTLAELRAAYRERYAPHPLITVRDDAPPATADVRGTARAVVHVALDEALGVITAVCVIDNLGKGASGQAVQAMNVALGLPETAGLPRIPLLP